jgi:hypothetical protein
MILRMARTTSAAATARVPWAAASVPLPTTRGDQVTGVAIDTPATWATS